MHFPGRTFFHRVLTINTPRKYVDSLKTWKIFHPSSGVDVSYDVPRIPTLIFSKPLYLALPFFTKRMEKVFAVVEYENHLFSLASIGVPV